LTPESGTNWQAAASLVVSFRVSGQEKKMVTEVPLAPPIIGSASDAFTHGNDR